MNRQPPRRVAIFIAVIAGVFTSTPAVYPLPIPVQRIVSFQNTEVRSSESGFDARLLSSSNEADPVLLSSLLDEEGFLPAIAQLSGSGSIFTEPHDVFASELKRAGTPSSNSHPDAGFILIMLGLVITCLTLKIELFR